MKRKILAAILLCSLLAAMLLTGCSTKTADSNTIVLKMSDEAKSYEKNSIATDGVKGILSEGVFEKLMEIIANRGEQEFPACTVTNALDCFDCEGSKVYTLSGEDYDSVVLYIHGGAWTFEISEEHVTFCDKLATKLHAKVYMPLYPLAPQATSEDTYKVIESLYLEVLKEEKPVYIMGDSAGGNITLGLMYTIKEQGFTKPDKMVLIAPCSDMTFTNKQIKKIDTKDPELAYYGCSQCAKIWAGEEHLSDPKNSAVYADVSGYPDTLLFQGTKDILAPDNFILYQNLLDAGVNATLVKGERLWHVFPIYPIPEQDESIDLIAEFCGVSSEEP